MTQSRQEYAINVLHIFKTGAILIKYIISFVIYEKKLWENLELK